MMTEFGSVEVNTRHEERLWVAFEEFKVIGNEVWRRCTGNEGKIINTLNLNNFVQNKEGIFY